MPGISHIHRCTKTNIEQNETKHETYTNKLNFKKRLAAYLISVKALLQKSKDSENRCTQEIVKLTRLLDNNVI